MSNVTFGISAKVPAKFAIKSKKLENTLTFWKQGFKNNISGCPATLAYIFEYLYTEQTLSCAGLKAGDATRAECLRDLCEKHGFLFFLAKLEHGVEGECDGDESEGAWADMYQRARRNEEPDLHNITEVTHEWLKLQHIVKLDGTTILQDAPCDWRQIVQKDPFAGDPTFEDFSGPTGNSGVSTAHYYHRTVSSDSFH